MNRGIRRLLVVLLVVALAGVIVRWRFPVTEPPPAGVQLTGYSAPAPQATARPTAGAAEAARARGGNPALLELMRSRLNRPDARANEALLTFASAEAYQRFLARAAAGGLTVLGQIEGLQAVRVRYDAIESLERDLTAYGSEYQEVGANFLVRAPRVPVPEDRAAINEVPFGDNMLAFLGALGDRSDWGRGVTIAILDSGVALDPTFAGGRVQSLDIGLGTAPGGGANDGHGTAVASLAAGEGADAPGVASAAGILSIRVTDEEGLSDIFTLAQGVIAAVDGGARIVNISMGGYQTSAALTQAIAYATSRGAVVVASAGNDQAGQLTWPAADARVISVGAVDALGQQVAFSNSGPQLQVTAPGYGVQAAWLGGERVSLDGTSASAPIVAGAIAAVMSESPGLSAVDAWNLLRTHASEGGPIGSDPAYGNGILNVGSTLNRQEAAYADTAIASHYFDPAAGAVVIVVQNRGSQPAAGLRLTVTANGTPSTYAVSTLAAGASAALRIPVERAQLAAPEGLRIVSQLANPAGVVDAIPSNNRRASSLSAAP